MLGDAHILSLLACPWYPLCWLKPSWELCTWCTSAIGTADWHVLLGARSVYACGLSFCAVLIGTALGRTRQGKPRCATSKGQRRLVGWPVAAGDCRLLLRSDARAYRAPYSPRPRGGATCGCAHHCGNGLVLLGMDALRGGASASTLGALLEVTRAQWTWLAVFMCFLGPRWQPATLPSAGARPGCQCSAVLCSHPGLCRGVGQDAPRRAVAA